MAEKLKKEDFVTIFLVHLYLDVVPEVLLMVGTNFLAYISPLYWFTKKKKIWRRCSLSSVTLMLFSRISWWLERKVFFTKLVDNREWEMHTKFHDDRTINSWEIEEKRFRHNIPCAPSPWCCSWGSSDGRNEFSFI